jgi:hypothetical protein
LADGTRIYREFFRQFPLVMPARCRAALIRSASSPRLTASPPVTVSASAEPVPIAFLVRIAFLAKH